MMWRADNSGGDD